MTTIKDLENAVKAVTGQRQEITLGPISLANPNILSDLGPLTSKLEKDRTIDTAIALNYVLGENRRYLTRDIDTGRIRIAIRDLAKELRNSDERITSKYSQSVSQLFDRCNHSKITASIGSVTKALTPEPTTPLWATALDIALATGLSMVPFVGPTLAAGATGGLGKLISGGIGIGVTYVNKDLGVSSLSSYNSDLKATTSVGDGLKQMPGTLLTSVSGQFTSKTTAGSALVAYLAKRDENKAKKTLTNPQAFVTSFSKVINPMTQNQILNNDIFDTLRLNLANSSAIITAKQDVVDCLSKESDTVETYIDKFGETVSKSAELIATVVNASIIGSFNDLFQVYDQRLITAKSTHVGLHLFEADTTTERSKSTVLALIITAYYLNPGIKESIRANKGAGAGILPLFDDIGVLDLINGDIQRGTPKVATGNPRSTAMTKLADQRTDIRGNFKDTTDPVEAINRAVKEGNTYITLVKSSMIDTINKVLFAHNNSGYFKEILSIFAASNMIVNSVWKAAATQGSIDKWFSEKFEVPKKAVAALKDAGFIKTYSTTVGSVSNEKKLETIGGATVNNQTKKLEYSPTNRKSATLRYYDGWVKGASDREKMMLYLFARAVTNDVNLFHVFMGVVDWTKVKELLHSIIAEINIASHSVDTKDMRPN
ncbi:hypothetical protein GCM10007301_16910 [Azorhizobium oxalatiphilum]|uniref:Uncharacterized protein n=2 Tax=Azorhizobium oxalatiphilum TaxID=980631 RepID=A0A917BWU2_9HYPH|nr:hypothetical protein GCM10007301_16910 [Azorhizobium oxalatiphilum]